MDDVIIFNGYSEVSPNSIFMLKDGSFIEAKNLKIGDIVVERDGELITILSIE